MYISADTETGTESRRLRSRSNVFRRRIRENGKETGFGASGPIPQLNIIRETFCISVSARVQQLAFSLREGMG